MLWGFNVKGKVTPDMLNPAPVSVGALTVTGRSPVDAKTTNCVAAVFTATEPNAKEVGLTLSMGTSPSTCKVELFETLPSLALRVTVCVVPVHCEVAVNATVVDLAATVTVAGTVTAVLLLERLTFSPPLGAGALSVTAQASVPDPAMDALWQETALNTGDAASATGSPRRGTVPPQPHRASVRLQDRRRTRLARL